MCAPILEKYGATPANIQWTVIRGDTAILTVDFYDDDEVTAWDIDGWTFSATVYDPSGDFLDALEVETTETGVTIKASDAVTVNWGTAYKTVVAELPFDLQATIIESGETTVWTPVIGTICVLGDVTPSGSL